jgi:hypothetical protein
MSAVDVSALDKPRTSRTRPRSNVGQSGDRLARYKEHWGTSLFHQEWRDGYLVNVALLEVCPYDIRHQREREWIWRFPRADLVNLRKRPPRWHSVLASYPRITDISDYMRRYKSNVDGFRNVHYDRQRGYYRVLVYDGRTIRWLPGDELPGGSESIWFSDLARAVSARDNKQHLIQALMQSRYEEDIIAGHMREQQRLGTEGGYVWD